MKKIEDVIIGSGCFEVMETLGKEPHSGNSEYRRYDCPDCSGEKSLWVEKNSYSCLECHSAHGDAVDLICKHLILSRGDACRHWATKKGLTARQESPFKATEKPEALPYAKKLVSTNYYRCVQGRIIGKCETHESRDSSGIATRSRRYLIKKDDDFTDKLPAKEPLPLYGLELMAKYPKAKIILTCYEEQVDAINNITDNSVIAMSFNGNHRKWGNNNIMPLHERECYFCPPNNKGEYGAATRIFNAIKLDNPDATITVYEESHEDDFSPGVMAMRGASIYDIINFVEKHAHRDPYMPKPEKAKNDVEVEFSDDPSEFPFRILGRDEDKYYFWTRSDMRIHKVSSSQIGKSATMMELADREYWLERCANSHKKIANFNQQISETFDDLVKRTCREENLRFNSERIRDAGVWLGEKGEIIVNSGRNIYKDFHTVDNKWLMTTPYVYTGRKTARIPINDPMSAEEASQVPEVISRYSWRNEKETTTLLTGLIVCSLLSGVLDYRPSGWITGEFGSGKSSVIEKFLVPLLGGKEAIVYEKMNTTGKAIRNQISATAIPVILDEWEKTDIRDPEVEYVWTMIRNSSSGEANTSVASLDGSVIKYVTRACFLLASVHKSYIDPASQSRVTMMPLTVYRPDEKRGMKYYREKIKLPIDRMKSNNFFERFRARIVRNANNLRHTIPIIMGALPKEYGERELDQLGSLLGGNWVAVNDGIIEEAEAVEYVNDFLETYDRQFVESEEKNALSILTSHQIRVTVNDKKDSGISKTQAFAVGEIMNCALSKKYATPEESYDYEDTENGERGAKHKISADDACEELSRLGVKLDFKKNCVRIAKNSHVCDMAFKRRGHLDHGGWLEQFMRLSGAGKSGNFRTRTSASNRGVMIPMSHFLVK